MKPKRQNLNNLWQEDLVSNLTFFLKNFNELKKNLVMTFFCLFEFFLSEQQQLKVHDYIEQQLQLKVHDYLEQQQQLAIKSSRVSRTTTAIKNSRLSRTAAEMKST